MTTVHGLLELAKVNHGYLFSNEPEGAWVAHAACGEHSDHLSDELFLRRRAQAVCTGCPVLAFCGRDALKAQARFGVWAGVDLTDDLRTNRRKLRTAIREHENREQAS